MNAARTDTGGERYTSFEQRREALRPMVADQVMADAVEFATAMLRASDDWIDGDIRDLDFSRAHELDDRRGDRRGWILSSVQDLGEASSNDYRGFAIDKEGQIWKFQTTRTSHAIHRMFRREREWRACDPDDVPHRVVITERVSSEELVSSRVVEPGEADISKQPVVQRARERLSYLTGRAGIAPENYGFATADMKQEKERARRAEEARRRQQEERARKQQQQQEREERLKKENEERASYRKFTSSQEARIENIRGMFPDLSERSIRTLIGNIIDSRDRNTSDERIYKHLIGKYYPDRAPQDLHEQHKQVTQILTSLYDKKTKQFKLY